MPKLTPEEFAEKWGRRLKGSTEDIRKGIDRVTESPMQKAIAKKDKMRTKVIEAIDSGRWEAGLRGVTTEEWKHKFKTKGIGRISAGVDESMLKMRDFGQWLNGRIDSAQGKIANMPDLTLEDNIGRMTAYIREMAKEKYKK